MEYPAFVRAILSRLWENGYAAYAVGGCVRDSLLGRAPHDWDIASAAPAARTAELFSTPPFHARVGNGLRHGTVTVCLGDSECEVTTFRRDGAYTDHRRPDGVTFVSRAEDDLARRDFTVNAMAACPAADGRGELFLDPFGGRADLAAGVIRCVGDPADRFTEDALRILRGIRFAARYGFTIEAETARAMRECAPLLDCIAPERIGDELRGILAGAFYPAYPAEFAAVFRRILPHCRPEMAAASQTEDVTVRLALLCGSDAAQTRETLLHLAFGKAEAERAARLIAENNAPLGTNGARCRLAALFGAAGVHPYFLYRRALAPRDAALSGEEAAVLALFSPGVCYNTATLAVTGRDLIAAGVRPGPALGALLERLTEEVIAGRLPNERTALLRAAGASL